VTVPIAPIIALTLMAIAALKADSIRLARANEYRSTTQASL